MVPVNITIDGKKIQTQLGQTVYEAATANGIYIPALCHHPALPPEGACRAAWWRSSASAGAATGLHLSRHRGAGRPHQLLEGARGAGKFVLELIIPTTRWTA